MQDATRARLSPRQREVAGLLKAGLRVRAISERLGVTERTARHHCDMVRLKLGFGTLTEMRRAAR